MGEAAMVDGGWTSSYRNGSSNNCINLRPPRSLPLTIRALLAGHCPNAILPLHRLRRSAHFTGKQRVSLSRLHSRLHLVIPAPVADAQRPFLLDTGELEFGSGDRLKSSTQALYYGQPAWTHTLEAKHQLCLGRVTAEVKEIRVAGDDLLVGHFSTAASG